MISFVDSRSRVMDAAASTARTVSFVGSTKGLTSTAKILDWNLTGSPNVFADLRAFRSVSSIESL
jgi:hypothetical protein